MFNYCATYTINQFPSCDELKLKQKVLDDQKIQKEEEQLINLCVQNLNAEHLPVLCQNLTSTLKEKVKGEAQKLGVSAQKLDAYKNITITLPQVNQDEEEQPWEIGFCAKRVFYSNHLPPFCEDKPELKEKIDIEVQKLKENNPSGGYKEVSTVKDNNNDKEDEDEDENEDEEDKNDGNKDDNKGND